MENNKRTILAIALSAVILAAFGILPQYFGWVSPKQETPAQVTESAQQEAAEAAKTENKANAKPNPSAFVPLAIKGPDVQGAINLKGLEIDQLCLLKYAETLAKDSPRVCLLKPSSEDEATYAHIGWISAKENGTRVPDASTLWRADAHELTPERPVKLTWSNGQGVEFQVNLALDEHYLITIEQSVHNNSGRPVSVQAFQDVKRNFKPKEEGSFTEYEGPIGVLSGRLENNSYKNVGKAGAEGIKKPSQGGWIGLTEKYWLTAVAAPEPKDIQGEFLLENGTYTTALKDQFTTVAPKSTVVSKSFFFAGAKDASLLEAYSKKISVPGLDKSIDFGWFSFLTRPILKLLSWLYHWTGNFGLGLMVLTLLVKLVLFPLSYKAAASQGRMRLLMPKMTEIKKQYAKDPATMNKKVMELYRTEKVNPASGCLPMLIQAPIFFCLYKMLNISLDERHAPFFGWIKDLSQQDPTNVFNLFGLLPIHPEHLSSFLHVSVWGIALGLTFFLVQKESMANMDPEQAKVMRFMPLFYVFFMSAFPAGLLIYYTWNNLLTFLQQVVIGRFSTLPVPTTAIAVKGKKGKK